MNNEEKILNMLEVLTQGQVELRQGQVELRQGQVEANQRLDKLEQGQVEANQRLDKLEQGQIDIKQEQLRTNMIIENEIRKNIKILAEGHGAMVSKLDDLKDIGEKVIELQMETSVLKSATSDLYRQNKIRA